MLTQFEFKQLLTKSENTILDFKADLYDFSKGENENAKFIKDVIFFSNTIRNETSYIIFGVSEKQNGELKLNGISQNIDDAILQEKVKDNVYPRPRFSYYTINYKNKIFGILDFPITKYELPLSPTKKFKGLVAGNFYFRNGTSNTEATGLDAIRIAKWIDSIPGHLNNSNLNNDISEYIIRLSNQKENLSIIIPELLSLAKRHDLKDIIDFCTSQIKGITNETSEEISYRKHTVLGLFLKADFSSNPYLNISQNKVKKEMLENKDFNSVKSIFPQNLLDLEDFIEKFSKSEGVSMTIQKMSSKDFLETNEDFPFYIYCLEDDYKTVYNNIRQKAIDLLMEK